MKTAAAWVKLIHSINIGLWLRRDFGSRALLKRITRHQQFSHIGHTPVFEHEVSRGVIIRCSTKKVDETSGLFWLTFECSLVKNQGVNLWVIKLGLRSKHVLQNCKQLCYRVWASYKSPHSTCLQLYHIWCDSQAPVRRTLKFEYGQLSDLSI